MDSVGEGQSRQVRDGLLEVRVAKRGGAVVVALRGELDGATCATARSALEGALGADGQKLQIDMRALEFIDSTGIALLLTLLQGGDGDGRVGFIPGLSPAVTRILEVTGVLERLPMLEDGAAPTPVA